MLLLGEHPSSQRLQGRRQKDQRFKTEENRSTTGRTAGDPAAVQGRLTYVKIRMRVHQDCSEVEGSQTRSLVRLQEVSEEDSLWGEGLATDSRQP